MQTRIQFNEELLALQHDILSMGTRVEEDLRKALVALREGDLALAKEVKVDDAVVNALQVKIEDQTAKLIATQQPVARDLRELIAVLKIVTDLERIGDHAVHLAKTVARLEAAPYGRSLERIERMAEIECGMIRDAISAFLSRDEGAAREIARRDDEVDTEHKAFIKEVLAFIAEHPDRADIATRLITLSSHLERLGDHVTNLLEAVVFMVTGEHAELN